MTDDSLNRPAEIERKDSLIPDEDPAIHCIVGIGASAGGLKALEVLLQHLPNDTGLTFVVVQHLSPDFKSVMDEILGRHTHMKVMNAQQGIPLKQNTVYLIPRSKNIAIDDSRVVLTDIDRDQMQRPVDLLLHSIAQGFGERAVGVILSGTGTDGVSGIRAIHEAGGLTVAQSPDTAQFDGMPANAIATECVNLVLPPEEIAQLLSRHAIDPTKRLAAEEFMTTEEMSGINLIFSLLCERHGINFADYKSTTVARRIERRIQAIHSRSIHEYAKTLQADNAELDLLYHDMLIGVTKFFRDSEAFFSLQTPLSKIVARLEPGEELRIWSAACATGEEPYTIAMLATELFARHGKPVRLKILATDVHQGALDFAAHGVYPPGSMEFVSHERQARFFSPLPDGKFRISADIRRHIVFARHNVMQDPPFTKLHLVSCRNMLIYLKASAQAHAIAAFHFALAQNGIMMLGASETPGKLQDEFETIDSTWRIFRKLRSLPGLAVDPGNITQAIARGPRRLVNILNRDKPEQLSFTGLLEAYDLLLNEFVECGLLLDESRNVLHVFGNGYRFLKSATGRFTGNIMRLLEGEARTTIGAALVRAQKDQETRFVLRNVAFPVTDGTVEIDVTVRSLRSDSSKNFVWFVEFCDPQKPQKTLTEEVQFARGRGADYEAIESELIYAKESLSATIEELETSNEELQSTNEEMVASNEELQSTNEELHSVNEELYSVNSENHRKITELHELTEDMENLLSSTDIGIVFMDEDLRIRKFTKAATDYFNLVDHDIGRRLDNFAHNLKITNLDELLQEVVRSDRSYTAQVTNSKGEAILMKILPYVSVSDRRGAVLNLVNVHEISLGQTN